MSVALFFDSETTGIKTRENPDFEPGLVQLAAVLYDLESERNLAEFSFIANQYPGVLIPHEATFGNGTTFSGHGIDDHMAAIWGIDPKLIDICFRALLNKADFVVAHNFDYDRDIVRDNLPLSDSFLDSPASGVQFCTMDSNVYIVKAPHTDKSKEYYSSKGIKPKAPYKVPSLVETYGHYFDGAKFENAHDAMGDVQATKRIFLQMLEEGWICIDEQYGLLQTDKFKTLYNDNEEGDE